MHDNYIQEGYILLARKIRKSTLWKSLKASHRIVLIELLLQAQFQDGEVARNGEILNLKRGQIATSYQQLVDDIGDKDITVKVVRNAINKLIKCGFVAKDEAKAKAKKGLLLTIENYCIYQNPENYKGKAEGKDKGKEGAKQGQSKGKEGAINNNGNNSNNGKNDKDIYGEFVRLTKSEYEKLNLSYGEEQLKRKINEMNFYISENPKKNYKNHYKALINWFNREGVIAKEKEEEISRDEELKKLLNRKKYLETELAEGKEAYEVFGNLHVYEFHKKELREINERL